MSHISNLPLQEMIAGVVRNATEKLAASPDDYAAQAAMDEEGAEYSEEGDLIEPAEGEDAVDEEYVEKLASACDFLAANIDNIEAPNRGVLGNAIAKMAGESVPPEASSKGALETTTGMAGEQQYKHDKPKPGFDAAASTANTPEGTAGLPGGATQMHNDMESAPGQATGSVPTATYPKAGPLHAGPTKTAGKSSSILDRLKDAGKSYTEAMKGGRKITNGELKGSRAGNTLGGFSTKTKGVGKATRSSARRSAAARTGTATVAGGGAYLAKDASAGEQARQAILAKLAGEDVMKSNLSTGKGGGALVGDGELQVMDVAQSTSNPTDGSGYGNQSRTHIQSNSGAIDYTKRDAKKPRVPELAEVLKNPAFSPKHDGKLNEQLQNAGQAGVKIAGAQRSELLKQAAANGKLTQEMVDGIRKTAMEGEHGCTCGGTGTCKSCKLEALKGDAAKTSMMGGDMGAGGGMGY